MLQMLTPCPALSPWTEIFQIQYGQTRQTNITSHSHVPTHSKDHLFIC